MIFGIGLLIYSLVMLVKFLALAAITDLKSIFTGDWKSEERNYAINHQIWTAAKSIIAFFAGIFLLGLLQ